MNEQQKKTQFNCKHMNKFIRGPSVPLKWYSLWYSYIVFAKKARGYVRWTGRLIKSWYLRRTYVWRRLSYHHLEEGLLLMAKERYVIRQEDVFCIVSAPHRLTCGHKYILHSRLDCWRVISYSPTERWCPQMLAIHTKLLISGWSPGARTTSMEANLSLLRSYVHRCRASRNKKSAFKYGIFGERLKENVR